jgi:hypothetical protein
MLVGPSASDWTPQACVACSLKADPESGLPNMDRLKQACGKVHKVWEVALYLHELDLKFETKIPISISIQSSDQSWTYSS